MNDGKRRLEIDISEQAKTVDGMRKTGVDGMLGPIRHGVFLFEVLQGFNVERELGQLEEGIQMFGGLRELSRVCGEDRIDERREGAKGARVVDGVLVAANLHCFCLHGR